MKSSNYKSKAEAENFCKKYNNNLQERSKEIRDQLKINSNYNPIIEDTLMDIRITDEDVNYPICETGSDKDGHYGILGKKRDKIIRWP